jgi:hypothetical protein
MSCEFFDLLHLLYTVRLDPTGKAFDEDFEFANIFICASVIFHSICECQPVVSFNFTTNVQKIRYAWQKFEFSFL